MDDWEARLRRKPEPLAWALGLMGVINGLVIDDVCSALRFALWSCNLSFDMIVRMKLLFIDRAVLAGLFGLAYFVAGAALSRSLRDGKRIGWTTPMALVFATIACGSMGLLVCEGAGQMAAVGMLASLPWGLLAGLGATRAWDVRDGTPAHRLFRRVMWLGAVGHAVTILSRLARRAFENPSYAERDGLAAALLALAGVVAATMLVKTLVDLWRLRRLEHKIANHTVGSVLSPEHHDLGLGEQETDVMAPGNNPYRDTERLLAHVRGDIGRLVRALRWGGAGLATVLVGLVVSMSVPLGTRIACL